MAIVFKDKKLQEEVDKLDLAFLVMHELCIQYGVYTSEQFEDRLKSYFKEVNNGKSNDENNHN